MVWLCGAIHPHRATDLLHSIHDTPSGLTLAELLALHPGVAHGAALAGAAGRLPA